MELHNINYEFPYKRAKLLTDAEMQLFKFMRDNLCQADKIVILVKVRLADIAEVDSRITLDKNFLWKITNKHVDFLICDKNNLDIIKTIDIKIINANNTLFIFNLFLPLYLFFCVNLITY